MFLSINFFVIVFLQLVHIITVECLEACQPLWTQHNYRCYKLYEEQPSLNWNLANEKCYSENAHLVNINDTNTDKEFKFFQDFLSHTFKEYNSIWVGLRVEPKYTWTDNTTLDTSAFNLDDYGDDLKCFTMSYKVSGKTCELGQNYICKKKANPSNQTCTKKWKYFRNHCYLFNTRRQLSWFDAEKKCNKFGGHLASISDRQEEIFLKENNKKLIYSKSWVGLKRSFVLTWTENSTVNEANLQEEFSYWYPDYSCVKLIYNGYGSFRWQPTRCSYSGNYVCEKPVEDITAEILGIFATLVLLAVYCVVLISCKRKSLKKQLKMVAVSTEEDEAISLVPENSQEN